ncbi:MAG: putative fatty-acid--CoA ligase, partial [Frankiales bacterium]|nr:putative fatty-acid--CoA ligase [Frankiales bacterium]
RYKCPRTVDFDPELPRSDTGKLFKKILREHYRAAHVPATASEEST